MRRTELALSCSLAAGCAASAIAQPLFHGLGDLPGGEFASRAAAISGDGLTVVGQSWSDNGPEAFAWRADHGMAGLGDLDDGAFDSRALGVSADGSIIVGAGSGLNGAAAFLWTHDGGLQAPGGDSLSGATAISADGSAAAGWSRLEEIHTPFLWSEGGPVPVDPEFDWRPGASVVAMSADGSVIAGWLARGGDRVAWLSRDGIVSVLPSLPEAKPAIVTCMASDGTSLGGYCWVQGSCVPTIWRDGEPSPLASLEELEPAMVLALSQDGTIGVGRSGILTMDANGQPASHERAVIWTADGGVRSIADVLAEGGLINGWMLTEATGTSADGTVVCGNGINPDGLEEAWVADLTGGALPKPEQN
jgi:uncharacterized membrane protein